jgi:hypothetical protein
LKSLYWREGTEVPTLLKEDLKYLLKPLYCTEAPTILEMLERWYEVPLISEKGSEVPTMLERWSEVPIESLILEKRSCSTHNT